MFSAKTRKLLPLYCVLLSVVIFICAIIFFPDSKQGLPPVFRPFKKDTVAPTITLEGDSFIILNAGQPFEEAGYTAIDDIDGDITYDVTPPVLPDTYSAGTHELLYTVCDSSGNSASAKRIILIKNISDNQKHNKTVYLTFDDGPCIYTEPILDILKKYNVKATFFVTAQKPEYSFVMKRIVDEGHAIAAHTYTHLYDIYKSKEAYFADLDKINNLIYEQTGEYTAMVRFPGGSSNLVSKKHKIGIMTELIPEMHRKGYVYFDWDVDSRDTQTTDPKKIAKNVTSNLKSDSSIVLMHDLKKANLESLPIIIEYCLKNGYTFAPLNDGTRAVHHTPNN